MATSIKTALQNIKDIYMSDSAIASLLDFERVIDELDVYAFANWKLGELVAGPEFEKYFVTCTFMWPYSKMPDPRGGEQLLNYNCEVLYKKDQLEYPVKPKSPDDFRPGTKLPKRKRTPIWLVTITMPKQLMVDIHKGVVEVEHEKIDLSDIEDAYEDGNDDDTQLNQQGQADSDDQMAGQMPDQSPEEMNNAQ